MDEGNPFEKVLDRLREKGWTKRSFRKPNGHECLVEAAKDRPIGFFDFLGGVLREQYPIGPVS